jgi:hypothetical protein
LVLVIEEAPDVVDLRVLVTLEEPVDGEAEPQLVAHGVDRASVQPGPDRR